MFFNQKFIMGMLTNFGSMALERIHNTLKVTIKGHFARLFIIFDYMMVMFVVLWWCRCSV